jgi:alginate O-acetyltransferase complex protein AlgI
VIVTEARFVVLLACSWLAFFAAPRRLRPHLLALSGLVFYGLYAGPFLPLVVAVVLATHLLSRGSAGGVAVTGLALLLLWLKLGPGWPGPPSIGAGGPLAAPLLPLGFSFLAVELMHFAIERRRGRIAAGSLADLMAFAFFFPCRVAGPIKRYPDFIEAVTAAEASLENVYRGLVRVLIGLFKKLVLADLLALTVAEVTYADTPAHAWKIVIAYALQIYLDFSAYSDIAIGLARVFGITVPENFRWPYLSSNIRDFWTRWHISLSSAVRDYVFLPVGRSLFGTPLRAHPAVIATISYLVAFLVVGAWHGLMWNFLVWGAYHGCLLAGYYVYTSRIPAGLATSALYRSGLASLAGGLVTFFLVAVGWVPFMTDLPRALDLLRLMFHIA